MGVLDKLGSVKNELAHKQYVERTQTIEECAKWYQMGHFHMDIDVKDDQSIGWMGKKKYITVTTAAQIFMSELLHNRTKAKHSLGCNLRGNLYQFYFPDEIKIVVTDGVSLTGMKNNAVSRGYKGTFNLPKEFLEPSLRVGSVKKETFPVVLHRVKDGKENHHSKDTITVNMHVTFDVTNEPEAKDTNVTPQFQKAMTDAEITYKGKDHKGFLKKHPGINGIHVVLIPGLFTGAYPGYFALNKQALSGIGVVNSIAPIKSEDPCVTNAQVIIDYLKQIHAKEPSARYILMAHSKGGNDILQALYMDPDAFLVKNLHGVIQMQSPVGGTPMVEWMLAGGDGMSKAALKSGSLLDKTFGLNATQAVTDLSLKSNNDMMNRIRHASQSAGLTHTGLSIPNTFMRRHGVPLHYLSFCAWAEYGESTGANLFSAVGKATMGVTNDKCEESGLRSDGMVTLHGGRMPGGAVILAENAYHTTPALHMPGNGYHSGHLTLALLDIFLTQYPIAKDRAAEAVGQMNANQATYNMDVVGGKQEGDVSNSKTAKLKGLRH